jgi:hypothetical protein
LMRSAKANAAKHFVWPKEEWRIETSSIYIYSINWIIITQILLYSLLLRKHKNFELDQRWADSWERVDCQQSDYQNFQSFGSRLLKAMRRLSFYQTDVHRNFKSIELISGNGTDCCGLGGLPSRRRLLDQTCAHCQLILVAGSWSSLAFHQQPESMGLS